MEELKYPIKYAIMPIDERTGTDAYGNFEYKRVANIAAKCYVVGEKITYNADGSVNTKYDIVFPYLINNKDLTNRIKPEINSNGDVSNSFTTNRVYTDFVNAVIAATDKNSILSDKERVKEYKVLERKMEVLTSDMNITRSISEEAYEYIEEVMKSNEMFKDFYSEVSKLDENEREQLGRKIL